MTWRLHFSGLVPVGLAALCASSAFGGAPTPFDQWSVSNGGVAATCGTGFQCSELSSGPGFLQRRVEDPLSGQAFVQTIVTGSTSTGVPATGLPFSDENFIKMGTTTAPSSFGISDKQMLHSESITTAQTRIFDSAVQINRGWAATPGTPSIDIVQKITESTSAGQKFNDTTHIAGNNDNNGLQTGTLIELSSYFSEPVTTKQVDDQMFVMRRVGGDMLKAAGTATLPGNKKMTWKAGDVIQVVWVGQRVDFEGDASGGNLSWQNYDNLSDTIAPIGNQSESNPAPFTWVNPPFGTAPAMPANGSGGASSSGSGSGRGGW